MNEIQHKSQWKIGDDPPTKLNKTPKSSHNEKDCIDVYKLQTAYSTLSLYVIYNKITCEMQFAYNHNYDMH